VNDGGSVVTYHDDQSLSPPSARTAAATRMTPPRTALQSARTWLGDVSDSFKWEATFVFLQIVFTSITIIEVSLLWEEGIGSFSGLQGLNAFSAAILCAFLVEIVIKTFAFGLAFVSIARNLTDVVLVSVAFALEVVVCVRLTSLAALSGETAQIYVASRIFRLLLAVARQRRARELITSLRTEHLRGQVNLSNMERTLGILRDLNKYPLSEVDHVQLLWCIDVIASQKLYTGFFIGPKGEPIRFKGVDDETAQWLVGNYSLSKTTNIPAASTPPQTDRVLSLTPVPVEIHSHSGSFLGRSTSIISALKAR